MIRDEGTREEGRARDRVARTPSSAGRGHAAGSELVRAAAVSVAVFFAVAFPSVGALGASIGAESAARAGRVEALEVQDEEKGEGREEAFRLECRDGYSLDAKIRYPDPSGPPATSGESGESGAASDESGAASDEGAPAKRRVLLLIHGSGPQSMDVDLTPVTKGRVENKYFVALSEALAEAGFTVVRYNKRSFQVGVSARADNAFLQSETFRAFSENPLKCFVEDAVDAVAFLREKFPDAEIGLLGHSQGTYVALQVAHQRDDVKVVGLIGFTLSSMEQLIFEQTLYRPLRGVRRLDKNGDDRVDDEELAAPGPVAGALRMQKRLLDRDGDGAVSFQEVMGGNLSNTFLRDLGLGVFKAQEAAYPRLQDILKEAEYEVVFFQGLLDNQTPAYSAMAAEIVAKQVWNRDNFRFVYFPGLGHALDPREDYDELEYGRLDPDAKAKMIEVLTEVF